jgi:hypothetical protein
VSNISRGLPGQASSRALEAVFLEARNYDQLRHARCLAQGFLGLCSQVDPGTTSDEAICRYQQLRAREVEPLRQRAGTVAGESGGRDAADPRDGEQRHDRLRNHRQVERDDITLANPQPAQAGGRLLHQPTQLVVGQLDGRAVVALPDQGGAPTGPRASPPLQRQVGEIGASADEPSAPGKAALFLINGAKLHRPFEAEVIER